MGRDLVCEWEDYQDVRLGVYAYHGSPESPALWDTEELRELGPLEGEAAGDIWWDYEHFALMQSSSNGWFIKFNAPPCEGDRQCLTDGLNAVYSQISADWGLS